jgi:hypothetical protein
VQPTALFRCGSSHRAIYCDPESMSAWQRIGIVLSLLWVFGCPIYLVIDQNLHAHEGDRTCRDTASTMASRWRREGRLDLAEAQEKGAPQECREGAGYTTLSELAQGLVMGGTNSAILWMLILGPVALFWIVGSAALATVRQVRRGFTTTRR